MTVPITLIISKPVDDWDNYMETLQGAGGSHIKVMGVLILPFGVKICGLAPLRVSDPKMSNFLVPSRIEAGKN